MTKPSMEHRHFVQIAEIIADMPYEEEELKTIAEHFANRLRSTNGRFDYNRFVSCAIGYPTSGRDSQGK